MTDPKQKRFFYRSDTGSLMSTTDGTDLSQLHPKIEEISEEAFETHKLGMLYGNRQSPTGRLTPLSLPPGKYEIPAPASPVDYAAAELRLMARLHNMSYFDALKKASFKNLYMQQPEPASKPSRDAVYASPIFQYLASGMKDKHAFKIVEVLMQHLDPETGHWMREFCISEIKRLAKEGL